MWPATVLKVPPCSLLTSNWSSGPTAAWSSAFGALVGGSGALPSSQSVKGCSGSALITTATGRCQRNRSPLQSLRGNTSNVEHRGAAVGVDVVATHQDAAADVGQG